MIGGNAIFINSDKSYINFQVLFTVRATDADKDERSRRIVYRLEGQGVGEFFSVDRHTGEIELLRPLDRDPPQGVPAYKFIVQAIDDDGNGLIGYADVQINLKVGSFYSNFEEKTLLFLLFEGIIFSPTLFFLFLRIKIEN